MNDQFIIIYNDFSIPDLVAIPDILAGAMENWGLIGFASAMLLFDPEMTSDSLKQDVCETTTHELAHQVSQHVAQSVASCLPPLFKVHMTEFFFTVLVASKCVIHGFSF